MKSRLLLAQLLCASFLAASVAHGGLFPVFNTNDSGAGSLRKAILDAAPGDTIIFRIPTTDLGYDSASHIYTITLTTAELLIGSDLTIDGGGQKIIVLRSAGAPNFRIIRITGGNVVISGLQIGGGNNKFPGSDSLYGGGIRNGGGNLSVLNCILFNNDGFLTGGGIYNAAGTLLVDGCTFATNTAYYGGALRNSATARINNSTFYFNSTSTGGDGGAIYNDGALTVTNSTITSNTTVNRGGGMACDPATPAHVRNTIIAGNNRTSVETSYDVFGPFVSDGYNFIGIFNNQATGFGSSGSHDQVGTTGSPINPALRPADSYGGLTPTQAPMPGSPVIDQGSRGTNAIGQPINSDQRGSIRAFDFGGVANAVGGDGSDIGAVEVGPTQAGPTFTVTNTASHDDGFCSVDDCTLLEALNASNAAPDTNTINFAANVFGTISVAGTGGLYIFYPVTLNGPGARNVVIDSAFQERSLAIETTGTVSISGLSFTRGGFRESGVLSGGAIYHSGGQLTLSDCAFSNNEADNGFGGSAIFNDSGSTLDITRCTFFNNLTNAAGGAIYNLGALTATNCTFSFNYALNGGAIISKANSGASSLVLRNCTFALNQASDTAMAGGSGGGAVYAEGNATQYHFSNNIIAKNFSNGSNPDLRGNVTSDGNNFVGIIGSASGLTNGVIGDQVGSGAGIDPHMLLLANNGGPTDTHALQNNSAAINAGGGALVPVTDQRGFGRSGVSDIGAFEFNGVPPPVTVVSAVSRKIHGGAGTFDIPLPLSGPVGVESRDGNHTVVFTFSNALTSVGSSSVSSGTGMVSSSAIGADPHQYVVDLSGVGNAQTITVSLANVTDSLAYHSNTAAVSIGLLLGDANADRFVNAADATVTRNGSGQTTAATNFRADYNLDGVINAADATTARNHSGSGLPGAAIPAELRSR